MLQLCVHSGSTEHTISFIYLYYRNIPPSSYLRVFHIFAFFSIIMLLHYTAKEVIAFGLELAFTLSSYGFDRIIS